MKTRQKRRRTSKKHCLCDCEATIKSPEIWNSNNEKKSGRSSLKVIEKSIVIQKITKTKNKKTGSIKKQIKNGTIPLKKSPSPPIEKTKHNNGKILLKQPYVLLKRLNIKTPTMELRRNRQKNYCEPPSLHDESTNEKSVEKPVEKPTEKIPIYKQKIEEDTKKTKKKKKKKKKNKIDDLYEFDSDSEETTHKQHKKRKLNDSSHDEYNKTIENILKNVALKIRARKHSPDKITANNNTDNNDEKCERTRINRRNVKEKDMSKKIQIEKIINEESLDKKTTNTNTNRNINNNDKDKRTRVSRRKLNEEPMFKKIQFIEDKIKKIDNQKSASKPSSNNIQHIEQSPELNRDSFTSSSKLLSNDSDETFGFLDDNEEVSEIPVEEQTNRTPKINIISNIKLKPHQQLIFTKNPTQSPIVQPNANSTMIYNVLTPWRFNEINIRRNPHLIQVKKSALPSITQEPVLEYSIIEKLANSSTPHYNSGDNDNKDKQNSIVQTPILRRSPRKNGTPAIQKTLDDYYGDNSENKENRHVITRYSLFDADELSPIKANEDKRSPLAKINSIKRQILADFNENTKENSQISTVNNLNKIEDSHNNNEVKTYFGFEITKESDDNSNIDNDKVNKDDHPYRLSISVNDKKYGVKKKRTRIEDYDDEEANEDPPNKVISDDDDDNDANDNDYDDNSDAESVDGGGLFEDIHDDKDKKENMTIKKRKVKWMLNDDDKKPKKRRKDVRTKKEEQAAERWAEQFNSMCKEVEEFPLEIE